MKRAVWVVAALAAVLGSASMAAADDLAVEDPRDVADVMDLARAAHSHSSSTDRVLSHTLSTHDAWGNDLFVKAELRVWVNTRTGRSKRLLVVAPNPDGSLGTGVYRAGSRFEAGTLVGFANTYRSDDRSVTFEFPQNALGTQVTKYRWKAFLYYPCTRAAEETCAPPMPDTHDGRVLHDLSSD